MIPQSALLSNSTVLFQSNSIRTLQTNWSLQEFPVSCLTNTMEVNEDYLEAEVNV